MMDIDDKSKVGVAITLCVMFLITNFLSLPFDKSEDELDFEKSIEYAISSELSIGTTHLLLSDPATPQTFSQYLLIGTNATDESRGVIRFPISLTSSDLIVSANLEINCKAVIELNENSMPGKFYPAAITQNITFQEATWNNFRISDSWSQPGADSLNDRTSWEPPATNVLGNNQTFETYELNVTHLLQSAVIDNNSILDLLIATQNGMHECYSSSSSNPPVLVIESIKGQYGLPSYVDGLFFDDGGVLISDDFLIQSELNPTISYSNLTGSNVDFQFSTSPNFYDSNSNLWTYSTSSDPFVQNSTAGEYKIPLSDSFSVNSSIHYRYRSIGASFLAGNWTESYFILPDYQTIDNGDGTATINLTNDMFDFAGVNLIEDGSVKEGLYVPQGLANNTSVSTGQSYSMSHYRIFTDFIGLSSNATIIDADLNLSIQNSSVNNLNLSLHETIGSEWNESQATWSLANQFKVWTNGGTDYLSYSLDQNISISNSETSKEFDISTNLQNRKNSLTAGALNLALIAGVYGDSYSLNSEFIEFYSKDSQINQPLISITYSWTNNSTIMQPVLTSPIDGKAVWLVNGHNITGNTRPDFNWDNNSNLDYSMYFELSNDSLFRNIIYSSLDINNSIDFDDGILSIPYKSNPLDNGTIYYWRMQSIDGDLKKSSFSYSSFLISSLSSQWLGNDTYKLEIYSGAEEHANQPDCHDVIVNKRFPDSNGFGSQSIGLRESSIITTIGLFHCDISLYELPPGLAIVNSQLLLSTQNLVTNNPSVSVFEVNNDWDRFAVTWNSMNSTTLWDSPGVQGSDRGSLLDTVQNIQPNQQNSWNVTQSVQQSVRNSDSVKFIIEITSANVNNQLVTFDGSLSSNQNDRPLLSLTYVPGSNELPSSPSLISPSNDSWSFGPGFNLTSLTKPTFEWIDANIVPVYGIAFEIDTSANFDSANKISRNSWNDIGFDLQNNTYSLDVDLADGEKWYWRVRTLSTTFQLGNWSVENSLLVPHMDTFYVDNDTVNFTLSDNSIFPQFDVPKFEDLYLTDGVNFAINTSIDSQMEVGRNALGNYSSAFIKLNLPQELILANATASNVELNLYSSNSQSNDDMLAVREVLRPWSNNATSITYDGVNNWTELGGRGDNFDIGHVVDVKPHQPGWNSWDITEIVQDTLKNNNSSISLMIYSEALNDGTLAIFNTIDAQQNQPFLNFTWKRGLVNISNNQPIPNSPQNNSILWDISSHALKPDLRPTFTWIWPNSQGLQPDDYRIIFDTDLSDDLSEVWVFDSRIDSSYFDINSLSFSPSTDIDYGTQIYWAVQPIFSNSLGEIGNFSSYVLPDALGYEINSTDAVLTVSEGLAINSQNYPSITEDTYFDQGGPLNSYNSQNLSIGSSSILSANTSSSTAAISFNLSSLQLPPSYDVMYANLTLNSLSGSGTVYISSSELLTDWDEQSTWSSPGNGNWINQGALRGDDSDIPTDLVEVNSVGSYSWDVTRIVQSSLNNQDDDFSFLLQPETKFSSTGFVEGNYLFADSENPNFNLRPTLEIKYRTINSWLPSIPTLISPVDSTTLWNVSSDRPSGVDEVDFSYNTVDSNITSFNLCHGDDIRWLNCVSTDSLPTSFTWDSANNLFTMDTTQNSAKGDKWNYWMIGANQDYRLGDYSNIFKYRTSEEVGTIINNGNYSIDFYRDSIFENTGSLPHFSDSTINAQVPANQGGSNILEVGYDSNLMAENFALLELNLSEVALPSLLTATSAKLNLMISSSSILGGSFSISAFACDSFDENLVTFQNSPTCSTTEITRTSILQGSNGYIEFDLTSLIQSNLANQNKSISIILKSNQASSSYIKFLSSDSTFPPILTLDYFINTNGLIPPSQTVLISPLDGSIMYDTTGDTIAAKQYLTLSWANSVGATDYSLFIRDSQDLVQRYDSGTSNLISGNSFSNILPFQAGETYSWWVQSFNQGIPGPASQMSTFAIGDPNHSFANDGTYNYVVQDSVEVPNLFHVNVQDFGLSDAYVDSNYGTNPSMVLGEGCHGIVQSKCHGVISLDLSQIPFNQSHSFHSINLTLFLETWDLTGGAYHIDLDLHQLLIPGLNEYDATWNNSLSTGNLVSGVDYVATPLDSHTFTGINQNITFSFNIPNVATNGIIDLIIISEALSTGGQYDGHLTVYSSDSSIEEKRPMFEVRTSKINSLTVSTLNSNFNVDDVIEFNLTYFDALSNLIPSNELQNLILDASATSGYLTFTNSSHFSYHPYSSGYQQIEVCFGTVCNIYSMTLSPGTPDELFASFDPNQLISSTSVNADQSAPFFAYMIDSNGNIVDTEVIDISLSNGTYTQDLTFYPYLVGQQTISVSWNNGALNEILEVEVLPGDAQSIQISGCNGVILAGTSCELYISGFDLYNNLVWADDINTLIGSAENGNISMISVNSPHDQMPSPDIQFANYHADKIGNWEIEVSSGMLYSSMQVIVEQGEITSISMDSDQEIITADEIFSINITSFDSRGNAVQIAIPYENWTNIGDGQLIEGIPTEWVPSLQGSRNLTISYYGIESYINIFITSGKISQFEISFDGVNYNNQSISISSDEILSFDIEAFDKNGNSILINANWTVSHSIYQDKNYLDYSQGDSNYFRPVESSEEAFELLVNFYELETQIDHYTTISISVLSGELYSFFVDGFTDMGDNISKSEVNTINSDDMIIFSPTGYDRNGNQIDNYSLSWTQINVDTQQSFILKTTNQFEQFSWEPTKSGNYKILSKVHDLSNNTIVELEFDFVVENGEVVELFIDSSDNNSIAGDSIFLSVEGIDQDGNQFPISVTWLENGQSSQNIISDIDLGKYIYSGKLAQTHNLTANYQNIEKSASIIVSAKNVANSVSLNLSSQKVSQLDVFTVSVIVFDAFGNQIEVSQNAELVADGRADVKYLGNGVWEIETLDEGDYQGTVTIGSVTETFSYTVEGNLAGFFAAGGSLYYVGAGLILLILLAILVFVVRLVRGDGEYYSDDDEEEFEYDLDKVVKDFEATSIISSNSISPTETETVEFDEEEDIIEGNEIIEHDEILEEDEIVEENETVQEGDYAEENNWMVDYRVEDDGTEWGQSDDGVWYYREVNNNDWIEWVE